MQSVTPRRWFRWSLRTMFVVVTVICCWLGWQVSIVRERKAILQSVQSQASDSFDPRVATISFTVKHRSMKIGPPIGRWSQNPIPWVRRMLGDEPVATLGVPESMTKDEILHMKEYFPEAIISGRSSWEGKGIGEWSPDR